MFKIINNPPFGKGIDLMILDITKSKEVLKKKTVVSMGIFDGVHRGHQVVINTACKFKDTGFDFVLFTFKTNTVTTKGKNGNIEMLLSDDLKKEHFDKMGVDYIYSPAFYEIKNMTAGQFVEQILHKKLNAEVVVCGEDFSFGRNAEGNAEKLKLLCSRFNIRTIIVEQAQFEGRKISSSDIRECIRKGEINRANQMLGYNYYYKLPVLHGNEIGRTLDFPTINQEISNGNILPRFGVYITRTMIGDKWRKSISNIGVKPTVEVRKMPLIETNILDFKCNIYGQVVKVELLEFLRSERKFESIDELKRQVKSDINKTKEYFKRMEDLK